MPDPALILAPPAPVSLAAGVALPPAPMPAAAGLAASFGDALAARLAGDPAVVPVPALPAAPMPVAAQAGTALPLAGKGLPLAAAADPDHERPTPAATPAAPDPARDPALAALVLGQAVPLPAGALPPPPAPAPAPARAARVAAQPTTASPQSAPAAQADTPPAPAMRAGAAPPPGAVRFALPTADAGASGGQSAGQDRSGTDTPAAPSPAPAAAQATPALPLLPALAPAAPADGGALALAAAPAPALPAHDMAALVDRLVEARSAAQAGDLAQPVRTTVHHGDFGPVALHFETGAGGLSVTASSADPGFASAAQLALAVAPASESAWAGLSGDRPGSQGQPQAQPGAGDASRQGGGGQPGGGARGEPPLARNMPAAPSTPTREAARDGAIFA